MSGLSIHAAYKNFGGTPLFEGFEFSCQEGELVVLVGPSGCGKSTLLRAVAGLESLDAGQILIGDRDVGALAPADREIAMVFQSYALYPQMTVGQNMAFPLRMAGIGKAEITQRVADAAGLLGLSELLERKPAELSGGQRQRVAIGRAIVRRPKIFLFDEPLSNLDAGLRVRMRQEFARLHRELATTTLYVTHDQAEAMSLADRIVLIKDGRIEQVGTPQDLYNRPATRFAADFFGEPPIGWFAGTIAECGDGRAAIQLGDGTIIRVPVADAAAVDRQKVWVGIRPEDMERSDRSGTSDEPQLAANIRFTEWFGREQHVHCTGPNGDFVWQTDDREDCDDGDTVTLRVRPGKALVFDDQGKSLQS